MKFGFIILNYKAVNETIELLYDLKKQNWYKDVKIYVVENGSNNGSFEKLSKINDIEFTLIKSDVNLGFARGHNLGIKKAREDKCDFVICSNSDIRIEKQDDFLKNIIDIYKKDKSIAVITPDIVNEREEHQNPLRRDRLTFKEILKKKIFYYLNLDSFYYFLRVYILFNLVNLLAKKKYNKELQFRKCDIVDEYIYAPNGAFFILTPTYFKYYPGLDENTFLYFEEYILAERLFTKNLKCYLASNIKVLHKGGKSSSFNNYKEKVKFVLKHSLQSEKYFVKNVLTFKGK